MAQSHALIGVTVHTSEINRTAVDLIHCWPVYFGRARQTCPDGSRSTDVIPASAPGSNCRRRRIPRTYIGSRLGGRDDIGISVIGRAPVRDAVHSPDHSAPNAIGNGPIPCSDWGYSPYVGNKPDSSGSSPGMTNKSVGWLIANMDWAWNVERGRGRGPVQHCQGLALFMVTIF